MTRPLPSSDLEAVLALTRDHWEGLRGERLFLTGGTGFFGQWLVATFAHANQRLGLGARAVVLTRDLQTPRARATAALPAVTLHAGDITHFPFPPGSFSHLLHAATDARASLNLASPLAMLDAVVAGTRRALDFAAASGVQQALLTSSGLVYGPQLPEMTHVPETYTGGPDPTAPGVAYAEGKRLAELLFATAHRTQGLEAKIARCYAFVGPHLPLDEHFAIGNFLRDALAGQAVRIGGDGTPYRSYMHPVDLMTWLWTILFAGVAARPYNVGSEDGAPLAEIAREVARLAGGGLEVDIAGTPVPGAPPNRYLPDTTRARTELALALTVPREEAILRTLAWHRGAPASR